MKAYNLGRVVGLSAYEIAVIKGYEGSIEEWLESLRYDHSDEYKQFTETIEQARKEIETGKSDIETSMSTIQDLVTNAFIDIENTRKQGVDAVNTAGTSAVNEIENKKSGALTDIDSAESEALTVLANTLTSAVRSLNEEGTRWKQQIKNTGEKAQFDYDQNAEKKQTEFDQNAIKNQTAFEQNAAEKTTAFDTHVSEKQDGFDKNATEKQTAFDENADQKTQEFDVHTEKIHTDISQLKEDLELMQRSMLLYIEDGNIINNYYISIRTLDINKKYAFFIMPSVDGIYTVQAGTASSSDKMIDTIASSVEILSSIGYMFYGYSPSISNINTLRLSGNVQWNLKVYEVCDSNRFLENSKRIEKNYILLSELFLTEDIILENPNYKLNKEIGTYVQTISAIATSNKIPCIPGDMIEYTLSSDGAVFVTYDNNGNVITVANSTGYSDIKTATHTFLSEEVSFRVSGSIDRYNKGLYSLKYKAGLKRFEKLEKNLSIVNANIVDINDNIAKNSKDIKKIKNSNINENLKPNDTYETDGCIYRCYNPYKNSGNLTLTGQLHCHTVGTGSGETQYMTPEQLCQYYKDNGYDFMTITDYSHINYYNGKPTHPITLPENFVWLCDSFEVSIPSDAKHPIKHMCLYNIQDNITISEYKSIQDMVDICKSVGGIISMAHPMYISTYYTSNMMKEVDNGLRFCEVYDGLIHSKGEERHPDDKETDFAWETLLDNGVITWGIAISDQHVANDFKNGCVKVFSDTLSRIEIMKNLCCGNFYATTNSDKKLNKISFENGEVIVETGDANAVVSFKKENGELLDTIIGEMAKYKLTGTEKYVRAIVTFEDGEKIWTQPIINISNMSDNYFA